MALIDPQLLPQFLAGHVEGMDISMGLLVGASVLVEIPIAMVLVAKVVTKHAVNRWANIAAAATMTIVQTATLFTGTPAAYYAFFSAIEIAATAFIIWYAWRWRSDDITLSRPV